MPPRFHKASNGLYLSKALEEIQYYEQLTGTDIVIMGTVLRGVGNIESFYRLYTADRAHELRKSSRAYGRPKTKTWLKEYMRKNYGRESELAAEA